MLRRSIWSSAGRIGLTASSRSPALRGSGKSHLAAIWAEATGARVLSARLLPHTDLPAAFATGALVLEDLEFEGLDERALFHFLNLAREQAAYVLITSRSPLTSFPVAIRDLASRMRAVPSVALAAPDDALLRALIIKLAVDRQIAVDESLVSFLANRIERSFVAAHQAVRRLDEEAMRPASAGDTSARCRTVSRSLTPLCNT